MARIDPHQPSRARWFDRRLPIVSAWLVLVYLALAAMAKPTVTSGPGLPADLRLAGIVGLVGVWAFFIVEFLVRQAVVERHAAAGRKRLGYRVLAVLLPPLHLGLRPLTLGGRVYVPMAGYRKTGRGPVHRLERAFSGPMAVVAVFILPVLLLDLVWQEPVRQNDWLAVVLDVSTRLIWLAFAVGLFTVLAASTRKVALPYVGALRAVRVLKVGKLVRARWLLRTSRTYRLWGVAERLFRAVFALRLLERLGDKAVRWRLEQVQDKLEKKQWELDRLRERKADLRRQLEEHRRNVAQREAERHQPVGAHG